MECWISLHGYPNNQAAWSRWLRRDPSGYEKFVTYKSCSYVDPEYPVYINNSFLHQEEGSLLITIENTTKYSLFFSNKDTYLFSRLMIFGQHHTNAPDLKSVFSSFMFMSGSIGSVQSSVVENPHHIGVSLRAQNLYSRSLPPFPNPSSKSLTTSYPRAFRGVLDLTSWVMTSTPRIRPPTRLRRSLTSKTLRLFGSRSMKKDNYKRRRNLATWEPLTHYSRRKSSLIVSPKKFMMPGFKCYFGMTDHIQHLRKYQDKMAVHSHDDHLLSSVFPSSLKGTTLWLVLLSLEAFTLEFRRGEESLLSPILLPTGA